MKLYYISVILILSNELFMNYLSTRIGPLYFATNQQTQVKMHNLCITNIHFCNFLSKFMTRIQMFI
jgi:hypothetical protein